MLYEVDVYLCLTTGCDSMKQCDVVLHHREENVVVCLSLGSTQSVHFLGMWFTRVIKSSHLLLVCLQHSPLHQHTDGGQCGVGGIHEFLACYLLDIRIILGLVPMR